MEGADQNVINLANIKLPDARKSWLSKSLSFIPTPYDINWYTSKQDFVNFANKVGFKLQNSNQSATRLLKHPVFLLKQLSLIV